MCSGCGCGYYSKQSVDMVINSKQSVDMVIIVYGVWVCAVVVVIIVNRV